MHRVCVFCGSSLGSRSIFADAAAALGRELAGRSLGLVYGGAKVGLMGVVADACLEAGGNVIGVMPEALVAKEIAHTGLPDLRVVGSMHERKAFMADLSDAFIALPGGFGTLEEFCEVLTWTQLGVHLKPCGLLDVDGYYRPLLDLFDRGVKEGLLRDDNRRLVLTAAEPGALLDRLAAWEPVVVPKWLGPDET
ncbi:MAG: TIGR00730 family Rossman fold protein [Acidimicrobiales bacterium]